MNSKNALQSSYRPPTISDVAREAGVSPKTVSRVINSNDYVSVETRERVETAIRQLNFRMNRAARSLASDRSAVIGLVLPDVSNPYYAEIVSGVEQVAHEHGNSVLLFNTNTDTQREKNALQILEEHRADGIIYITATIPDSELTVWLQRQRAAVLVGHDPIGDLAGIVNVDTYEAATQAVDHLVSANRRHIAYVKFTSLTYPHRERLRGVLDGLRNNGIATNPAYIIDCPRDAHDHQEKIRQFLIAHPEIDAMIGYHDLLALEAMEACDSLGITVPEQVAIIGFDDIPFSGLRRISLTTFHIPRFEVGVSAAHKLFNRIAGQNDSAPTVIKTTFVERDSTPRIPPVENERS